jgi:hypothetical protein
LICLGVVVGALVVVVGVWAYALAGQR